MIEVKNLVKKYGSLYAVDDISFSVKEGEIVGFLGRNGAGKSTTMNIITGYLSSTSGTVSVDGHDILEEPIEAKKVIGYLPEQPPLYPEMTVFEYLEFIYEIKGCTLNKQKHIEEVCNIVKIFEVKDRIIANLSKGFRQRVGIAQALIGNPKLIILDEPTVGLDPKQIIEIRNLIRNLGKTHTVILSTHILPEVQAVCDRVIIISDGKIVADEKIQNLSSTLNDSTVLAVKIAGPQKDVLSVLKNIHGVTDVKPDIERDKDAFSYIVSTAPNIDIRKVMFRAIADKGWAIVGLKSVDAELEDIFIRLTETKGENL